MVRSLPNTDAFAEAVISTEHVPKCVQNIYTFIVSCILSETAVDGGFSLSKLLSNLIEPSEVTSNTSSSFEVIL